MTKRLVLNKNKTSNLQDFEVDFFNIDLPLSQELKLVSKSLGFTIYIMVFFILSLLLVWTLKDYLKIDIFKGVSFHQFRHQIFNAF